MIETYQDEQAMEPQEPQEANFAEIAAIYADGVSLQFDGMDAPTQKHYLTNAAIKFAVGDRVRVLKDCGTYVVEYPVGAPLTRLVADYATEAGEATHATSADTATDATNAEAAESASSADQAANSSHAQNLWNSGYIDTRRIWLRVEGTGSSARYYINADNGNAKEIT